MNARRLVVRALAGLLGVGLLTGFLGPKGESPQEKRKAIQKMRAETLAELYKVHPPAKARIQKAAAYAVFSNVGVNLILFSAASGWGVAHDNRSGKDIYMKMVSGGLGIGLGVKDFRGVFVFADHKTFEKFVESGWEAGAQADAAAKAGEKGGAAAGSITVAPGMDLYQLTEAGLALQATVQGTKYYQDEEINQATKPAK